VSKKIFIVGAGGHAKVIFDSLLDQGEKVTGFCVRDRRKSLGSMWDQLEVIEDSDLIKATDTRDYIRLVNGVGFTPRSNLHFNLLNKFLSEGFLFLSVRHRSAVISKSAVCGQGSQVMAGAVLQASAKVGVHSILNTKSSLDHDSVVGAFSHIAPGATICGECKIGDRVFVGAGSVIGPGVNIGDGAVIGAQSVILNNVQSGAFITKKF
jgi:sugar O-acyltransferase (sialic acid O-acetyltransferase NeuD family)